MPKYWPSVNMFKVKVGDRERTVVIPDTGDIEENKYLEEAEREKTADELRKLPPRPVRKTSRQEVGGALREYRDFLKRHEDNVNPRYF